MQKLAVALAAGVLFACATPPKAPAPVPPPVIAPKPPSEPFGALHESRGDHVTRQQFKDHFLRAYSAADRLDGVVDGSAPILESCKEQLELCKSADTNGDGKLSLREFLDKLDQLYDEAGLRP